jgi:hypothetical protein
MKTIKISIMIAALPVVIYIWNTVSGILGAGAARSVAIVSDYILDDRVQSPAEAKDFPSSLRVQTSSEDHPASYPMGTRGPFPGVKRGQSVTLTTHRHLVSRSRMSRSYSSSPLGAYMAVAGLLYFYIWNPSERFTTELTWIKAE